MKNLYLFFVLFLFSGILFAQEAPTFDYTWDGGFSLKTRDSTFSLGFGGNISLDHAYYFQDEKLDALYGPFEAHHNTDLRKARIYFHGQIYRNTEFAFQVDFAGDNVSIKDMFIGLVDVPIIQNIRVGHLYEPFRYSTLTSTKFTTFMERAPNSQFSPGRNTGILLLQNYLQNRISSQIGIFANAGNTSSTIVTDDGYAVTGRITGLPIYQEEGQHVLHLGVAFSYRKPKSREYGIKVPVTKNVERIYTTTGLLTDVSDVMLANFEAVYFRGPLTLQFEYLTAHINQPIQNLNFQTIYGEVSWSLTGDRKNYRGSYYGTGKMPIKGNYGKGIGSWEVAAGYAYTDLRQDLGGISRRDLSLGINWYLNPAARVMINYVRGMIPDQGVIDVIQGRIQIGF
ncbi:MAG TPA: porin [Flavobacteriaceae bacterium]|nr:porin [Flavobacteriaceae bacterium]